MTDYAILLPGDTRGRIAVALGLLAPPLVGADFDGEAQSYLLQGHIATEHARVPRAAGRGRLRRAARPRRAVEGCEHADRYA